MRRIRGLCRHAALGVLVIALAAFAHAEGHAHKHKDGKVKITAPTEIGGTVLQPGSYIVREVDSEDGVNVNVEFSAERYNPSTPEGVSPWDDEVVARLKASEQLLSEAPRHTQLEFGLGAQQAVALDVKGDRAKYWFEPSSEASAAGAMAGQADSSR